MLESTSPLETRIGSHISPSVSLPEMTWTTVHFDDLGLPPEISELGTSQDASTQSPINTRGLGIGAVASISTVIVEPMPAKPLPLQFSELSEVISILVMLGWTLPRQNSNKPDASPTPVTTKKYSLPFCSSRIISDAPVSGEPSTSSLQQLGAPSPSSGVPQSISFTAVKLHAPSAGLTARGRMLIMSTTTSVVPSLITSMENSKSGP
mmetsp:Transcript_6811/g.23747  ORF Transcript_6811/g.23747 Transcript_6811/m.23747 type:complete len:208 (-) Transcript_6811:1232-1855(-)